MGPRHPSDGVQVETRPDTVAAPHSELVSVDEVVVSSSKFTEINLFCELTITSNDHSFGCPINYTDTTHYISLIMDTSTTLHTTKLIL